MALMHGLRLSVLNEIFCKNASDSFVGLFPYPDTKPVWAFMDNGENNEWNVERTSMDPVGARSRLNLFLHDVQKMPY
jgi:hypothetical protein